MYRVWVLALCGLCTVMPAVAADAERRSMTMELGGEDYIGDVGVPPGWSLSPRPSRNSRTLYNVAPGQAARPTAFVRIFVEPRLDHEDALKQLAEFSALAGKSGQQFVEVGGWPAMQFSRIEENPPPDNAPDDSPSQVLRVYTYIAVDDALITVSGSAPAEAGASLVGQMRGVANGLRFDRAAVPERTREALDTLRASKPDKSPGQALQGLEATPRSVTLDVTPVEITAELGANDRINTNGFGELEIAVSPDGQDVVVALQSRRWVSSNDGGASFPNSGRVGTGNGDPSVAWAQSGRFYMAWIDNSATCNSAYLNPVVAPDLDMDGNPDPAPNGLDCTGIARSDDDGVTFDTNTVNPAVVCIGRAPAGMPPNPGECFPDQEHIAADRWNAGDTANDDQVYSTWRNFMPGSQDAGLVCSSDSGVTWSAPFDIGTPEVFPRITVGPDGFVYVATYNGLGYRLYKFTSCVNGLNPVPGFPVTVGNRDPYQCPFAGHDRCDQNPTSQTVAVDETDPNHVYYAYVDDRGNGSTGDSDIIVRDSLDGGLTWNILGRVARANENVGARRIMPWVCTTAGDAVVTWFEQRGALPTDSTDFFGARVGLDGGGDLVPMEEFVLSEVSDNWCEIGWQNLTRWGNTDTQLSNAAEACPNQPQLAGQCGDGDNPNVTPDSGALCDFSDDDGVTFTNCQPAATSPSGNDERCLPGGGVPKYGDYNGNACAGGKLFAAWASANAPDGLAPPDSATNPGVLFEVINLSNLGVPVITVPGSVQFGDVCPSDPTRFATLEVCNTGSANLQVDVISSDNPDFAVTVPSSGFPVTISPDFCFPFEVAYTPTGEPPTAILTVPSDDPDRPSIDVVAAADLGEASVDAFIADSGNFGEVCSGLATDKNLTIQNNGSCDLQIDAVTLFGPDASDFELPDGSLNGTLIEAGNSLQVPVRFAPDAFGDPDPRTAGVEVASRTAGDGTLSPIELDLSGSVPPPDINVAIANSGAFGDVCKGETADLGLTLFNQGRCDLTIDGISTDNPLFVLPADTQYPLVLSHDADFNLPVRFAPEACSDTPETGTITIDSDSPGEEMLMVDLSAASPCPNLVIDPNALTGDYAFPATVADTDGSLGCYTERTTVLRNSGACPLTISDIAASGIDYTVMAPTDFPVLLPPGEETLNVTVRFAPQSLGDPLVPEETLGTLTVTSDDPDITSEAAMCGEGVARSGIRVLVTDTSTGLPLVVDSVDAMNVKSKGKNTPSPINLSFTDVEPLAAMICGNQVTWHLNLEQLPATETTGSKGGKSQYEADAREGNLQDKRSFDLDQCEFSAFQLQLLSSDGGDGGACLLAQKGEACSNDAECCSGKCRGPDGAMSCK